MRRFVLFITFFCICSVLHAQTRLVNGTIKDDTGAPVSGATVTVVGQTITVISDANGQFAISVPPGDATIAVTSIGYASKTIPVGAAQSHVDVIITRDSQELSTVVVTALGITRQSKTLTYSAQQVSGNELQTVKNLNPINSLNGKVAGLQINRSSGGRVLL